MKAIWKSKNVAGIAFDKLYDYPRDRYSRDRRAIQEVTILDFELTQKETEELIKHFPSAPVKKPKILKYITSYTGEDKVASRVQFEEGVETKSSGAEARVVIEAIVKVIVTKYANDAIPIQDASATSLDQIADEAPVWEAATVTAIQSFDTAITTWINAEAGRQSIALKEREKLKALLVRAKQGDPSTKIRTWVEENLPIFIYFDEYGQLETRIHLPMYLKRKDAPDPKTRTQMALFEWSNLNPQEILTLGIPRAEGETDEQLHRRHEKRRALLDSASFALTGDWISWWAEKRHKLHFDADGEDLVLKVSDEHNEFPIPFEERSHGLKWFFSFYGLCFQRE